MLDYLVVGQGIAGSIVSYLLHKEGKDVLVVDNVRQDSSSRVAAGIFNPITGKKLVKSWRVDDLFPFLHNFYTELEKEVKGDFFFLKDIVKPIQSVEEQNFFISKSESSDWTGYVDVTFPETEYADYLQSDFGGARLKNAGWVDTRSFIESMCAYFKSLGVYKACDFDFADLKIEKDCIHWKNVSAKKIIFCEGFRVINNPFFSWLPFRTTKGEQLIIEADLPEEKIINKGVFILPKGNQRFLIGSTFELTEINSISEKGREQLVQKLDKVISIPYKIVDQISGIRPTVSDRKPIIGPHPELNNCFIFNGLGTKGVSLAPFFGKQFIDYLEGNVSLEKEVCIERFYKKYL